MLRPETFFHLESFEYVDLFDGVEFVWEVLPRLKAYLVTNTPVENRIVGHVHPGTFLIGQHILIEEGAIVEDGAYIEGPCIIGRNCLVRHSAYVRAGTLAGAGSLIGHATETKNAVLLPGSKASHFAYVGDSILGNRVNLGAGTKLANWRLDGGIITVRAVGQRYSSGLQKLGAIIGDDCQLGCNVVCNPGTLIGPRTVIYPLTSVYGHHPADSILKPPPS